MELTEILQRTAIAVVERGTNSELLVLRAMASAASTAAPGAAAALIDANVTEIARLRAFGIVHGVIVYDITEDDRNELLHALLDVRTLALVA